MSFELLMRTVSACSFLALGSLLTTTLAIAATNVGTHSRQAQCRLLACPATIIAQGAETSAKTPHLPHVVPVRG